MKVGANHSLSFSFMNILLFIFLLSNKSFAEVQQPKSFNLDTVYVTDVTGCYGDANGVLEIEVSGGTLPYEYSIDGGLTYVSSNTFTGLPAGLYEIFVKDAFNLIVSDAKYIDQPTDIQIVSENYTDVTGCYGDSNGSISIVASGGAGSYEYSTDNGTTYFANGGNFTGLAAGTYTIKVRDMNNCSKAGSVININQPNELIITAVNKVDVTGCNGDSTGRIEITSTGGSAPIEYSIDGGITYQSGYFFPQLRPGIFDIYVKDVNNCITTGGTVSITEPAAISINSAVATDVSTCYGDNTGSIQVSASGGTGILYYSHDGGINYFSNGGTFNNLYAGAYEIIVQDKNFCTVNGGILNVGQPDPIIIDSEHATDVSTCFGDATGSITINAHGGISPLEYSVDLGGTYQLSNIFNNLPASSYTTIVRDANGCSITGQDHIITQPPLLAINEVNTTNVSICYGGTDGTIHIVTNGGGTPSYDFSINGGATYVANNDFSGLSAGIYSVIVRDTHNCTDTFNSEVVEITQPAELVILSEIETDLKCFNDSSGIITVNATGGTGEIFYSPDNGTHFFVNNILTGLKAGIPYQIVVQDENGCTSTGGIHTLSEPAELLIDSINALDVNDCNGGSNGSITVYAQGGTPALEYSNDPTGVYQASNVFSGLSAGNYPLMVKDANNCKKSGGIIHIQQPDLLEVSYLSKLDVIGCKGDMTGEIHIDYLGGTPPIEYSVDGGTTFFSNNGDFTGLAAGTYNILIRDANGCTAIHNPVEIGEPEELTLVLQEKQDISCFGDATGYINLHADGGKPEYSYSIDNGSTFSTGSFFSGLPTGSYQTFVRDIYGCTKSGPLVTINQPDSLSIDSVISQNVDGCYGDNDGTINVYVSGGTPGYMYSINQGNSYFNNSGNFTGLTPGNYYITIYDANVCQAYWYDASLNWDTVRITQPPKVEILDITTDNISCTGSNDGVINILATGGTGNLHYSIDNGINYPNTTGTFTGLSAGDYIVKVADDNACESNANTASIYEPDSMKITDVIVKDEVCLNANDGSITINTSGGTYPYQFSIDGGVNWVSTKKIENLAPGTYTPSVRDTNGCSDVSSPVTINSSFDPSLFAVSDSIGCSPLDVQFTRINPGVTYLWDFGDGESATQNEPAHTFVNTSLSPVNFLVTAYSASPANCQDTAYKTITVYPQPQLDITASPTELYYPNSEVSLINNSPGGYTNYYWDFGDGTNSTAENPGLHTYTDCGEYTISISADNTWCSDTLQQFITVTAMSPEARFDVDTTQSCVPVTVNFANKSFFIDSIQWDLGDGITLSDSAFSYTWTTPGEYLVRLNAFGYCNTSSYKDTTIYVYQSPTVNFDVIPDTVMLPNQPIRCINSSSEDADLFFWDFGDGRNSQEENPIHFYTTPGTYDISLTVTSVNKCTDSLTLFAEVVVLPEGILKFPNAFSPNGDGDNDIFIPAVYESVQSYELVIYNRWGEKMFYTTDITEGWDGYFNGNAAMQDVYVWQVKGLYLNGTPFEDAGSLTLLR